jgi:NAD(P)-dependent dehydrogenase (short-subunit alcohol dehydrogenase family)
MDVSNKAIIVTGASRGIGKQAAIEFGRRGANVVVAARTVAPHKRLAGTIGETVEAVEAAGGQALAVPTDLTDVGDIDRLVAATLDRFGRIDVLVNNAADTSGGSVVELDRDAWLRQFATNLHAPFSLIQAVLAPMSAVGGGIIVNVTSGAADLTPPADQPDEPDLVRAVGRRVAYSTSKAALNRMGNIITPELRRLGIALITVDPGFTRTELLEFMGERGVVDISTAHGVDVPVKTIVHVVSADDPLVYTSVVVRAPEFVVEHRL